MKPPTEQEIRAAFVTCTKDEGGARVHESRTPEEQIQRTVASLAASWPG